MQVVPILGATLGGFAVFKALTSYYGPPSLPSHAKPSGGTIYGDDANEPMHQDEMVSTARPGTIQIKKINKDLYMVDYGGGAWTEVDSSRIDALLRKNKNVNIQWLKDE